MSVISRALKMKSLSHSYCNTCWSKELTLGATPAPILRTKRAHLDVHSLPSLESIHNAVMAYRGWICKDANNRW